jgi:hypothetical protein
VVSGQWSVVSEQQKKKQQPHGRAIYSSWPVCAGPSHPPFRVDNNSYIWGGKLAGRRWKGYNSILTVSDLSKLEGLKGQME